MPTRTAVAGEAAQREAPATGALRRARPPSRGGPRFKAGCSRKPATSSQARPDVSGNAVSLSPARYPVGQKGRRNTENDMCPYGP